MCPRTDDQFKEMRQESTSRILDSAIKLFAQKGFHGASMEAIAKEAGISKGLAYNYFKSKDEILAAIVEKRLNDVNEILTNVPTKLSSAEKLHHLLRQILTDVSKNIELYRLYFAVFLQPGVSPALAGLSTKIKTNSGGVGKTVKNIFEDLGFSEPSLEAALFFSTIQGVAMDFVIAPEAYPLAAMTEYIAKKYRSSR